MRAVFKTLVLLLSLYVVHWTIVKLDKQQNELGIESTGTAALSLGRLPNNGVGIRKLLTVNSTALSGSKTFGAGYVTSTAKPNLPCMHFLTLNKSRQCKFIKTQLTCQMSDGFFQYLQFPYCQLSSVPEVAFILLFLWLVLLFVMLGATADEYFCPSLTVIYKTLKISEDIARGVTFLAYGNGAPDVFSAVTAFSGHRGGSAAGLAFNSLLGAGIFVTTVVVGAISFTGPFTLTYRPFARDVLLYLGAVAWAFITFNKENITLYESIGYIVFYVVYVLTVVIGRYVYQRWKSRLRFLGNNAYLCAAGIEESREQSPSWRGGSISSDSSEVEVNINRSPGDQAALLNDSQENEKPQKKKLYHNVAGALLATENTAVLFAAGVNVKPPTLADENTPLLGSGKTPTLTPWMKFWKGVQPWDDLEWRRAGILNRAFIIFKSPATLCLNLTVPVVDLDEDDQHWNKWLNAFHCLMDPVFCVFITRHAAVMIGGKLPLWSVMLAAGVIMAMIVALSTASDKPPRCHWVFAYIAFIVSVIWIYTTANEIVNLLQTFGIAFKISDGILGLTFLAWGNSIGDFISDMAMARQGFPRMAISACFSGALLNILLGIGVSCTVATATSGRDLLLRHDSNQYIISTGFQALILASSAIAIPLTGFRIPRAFGVYLIILYVAYLALSIAEELKHF